MAGYALTGFTGGGGVYDSSAHSYTVGVGADSRDVTVTADNAQLHGYIEVIKDDGRYLLGGAVFEIRDGSEP